MQLLVHFLLYPYYFLAILRLHNTIIAINLNRAKFYYSLSKTERTNSNAIVILQHKGKTTANIRDRNANM